MYKEIDSGVSCTSIHHVDLKNLPPSQAGNYARMARTDPAKRELPSHRIGITNHLQTLHATFLRFMISPSPITRLLRMANIPIATDFC